MAGKIDKQALQKAIFSNKNLQREVLKTVKLSVEKDKNILIDDFIKHPVTQELDGGENAENISGTLGGYGNLFSFIGFVNGSSPTNSVINLLKNIKIGKNIRNNNNIFMIDIFIPSKNELGEITKMPWESGRSWLWDIEKSISGLGAYLYGKFEQSRSGNAIQSRKNFSGRNFSRVSYFTPLYNKFIKKIGGNLK
jgi:hypothetical protein